MSLEQWIAHTEYERERIRHGRVARELMDVGTSLDKLEERCDRHFEHQFELTLPEADRLEFLNALVARLVAVGSIECEPDEDDPCIVVVSVDRSFRLYLMALIAAKDGGLLVHSHIQESHFEELSVKFVDLVGCLIRETLKDERWAHLRQSDASGYMLCLRTEDM